MSRDFKKQHWIPKSYTLAWADPDVPANKGKRIHLYGNDGRYLRWEYPPNVFTSPELYTRTTREGSRDIQTEKDLSRIESDFARVKRRLFRRETLQNSDRAICAAFVTALRNRSPTMRDHYHGMWKEIVDSGERFERELKNAPPSIRRRTMHALRGPTGAAASRSFTLDEARVVATAPFGESLRHYIRVETPILAQLKLSVLHTSDRPGFISSDNPVVWWLPGTDRSHPFLRPGLGHRNIEITVPVSPEQCLLFTHSDGSLHRDISAEMLDQVNMRTLASCREVFIANSPELTVDWLDENPEH